MSKKYICVRECIFRDRRYKRGERLVADKGESIPHHFSEVKGSYEEKHGQEINTFSDITVEMKKEEDKAVYSKLSKKDLIAEGVKLGHSHNSLNKKNRNQIIEILTEAKESSEDFLK